MSEKMKENFEVPFSGNERKESVQPFERVDEVLPDSEKKELLENIMKKGGVNKKEGAGRESVDSGKNVFRLIKEFFIGGGVKTVDKARKILDAHDLDEFHDEITRKGGEEGIK